MARIGALGAMLALGLFAFAPSTAGAAELTPTSASWCSAHGSSFGAWAGTNPEMAICGPGPNYGGTWSDIDLPGPSGLVGTYYNATPGFQCVELAERFLAVSDGLAPLHANGAQVAAVYHAAYPGTRLILDGSTDAIGNAPVVGDVVSFSFSPYFGYGDGHVAVVVSSNVDASGDGSIVIAQENVSPADYLKSLDLVNWRLSDPTSPGDAEYDFPYAEWLVPHASIPPTSAATETEIEAPLHTQSVLARVSAQLTGVGARLGVGVVALRPSAGSRHTSLGTEDAMSASVRTLVTRSMVIAGHTASRSSARATRGGGSVAPLGVTLGFVPGLGLFSVTRSGRRSSRRAHRRALRLAMAARHPSVGGMS